jgi:hypothetical protein
MVLYYVFTAYALRAFLLPSRLLKHPLNACGELVRPGVIQAELNEAGITRVHSCEVQKTSCANLLRIFE